MKKSDMKIGETNNSPEKDYIDI